MNNKEIYDRSDELSKKLNNFLFNITGVSKDYFSTLTQKELLDFKIALSDVNNVLTLKTTLALGEWISVNFQMEKDEKLKLIQNINKTKPNTNGYDIQVNGNTKIIAEIKCIIPINNSYNYGSAQGTSILNDAIKLRKGTKSLKNTSNYIKLIGLIDLGEKTNKAIQKLITPPKTIKTKNHNIIERHEIKKYLKLIDSTTDLTNLSLDKIYLKMITI